MPGGRPPRLTCKHCGGAVEDRSELSKRGYHRECGVAIKEQALMQIHSHSGPYFKHWRQQMALSVGGVLLDDVLPGD